MVQQHNQTNDETALMTKLPRRGSPFNFMVTRTYRAFVGCMGLLAVLCGPRCQKLVCSQSLSAQHESALSPPCSGVLWQQPRASYSSPPAVIPCEASSGVGSVSGDNVTHLLAGLAFRQPPAQFGRERAADQSTSPPIDANAGGADAAASVSGAARDTLGIPISAARVTLLSQDKASDRVITADANGAFVFSGLRSGTYRIRIDAPGVEPFTSSEIILTGAETREIPVAAVRMAVKNTTVNVVASLPEVAEAQVKQQEEQRILGFLPNFYTSYVWDALPMTRRSKFTLALRSVTDPATFLVVGGVAATEQAHNTFPGYGQEFGGYAKRYGAAYADTVAGRMLSGAIFPVILHQDPRYFYQGSGTVRSRLLYALVSTVVCRGDNGRLEPNYSHILGSFSAAGLSNLYRAPSDRQAGLTLRNGLIITASGAIANVMREFLSRKLTPNVPAFANGKP